MRLTTNQRRFVAYYLGEAGGNATEAARLCGYKDPRQAGYRLTTNVDVRQAIAAKLDKLAMGADEVLARLSEVASGSLGDFIEVCDNGGYRIDLRKAKRRGALHLIKSLKPTELGVAIELRDPLAALDKLARYHNLYETKPSGNTMADVFDRMSEYTDPDEDTDRRPGEGAGVVPAPKKPA